MGTPETLNPWRSHCHCCRKPCHYPNNRGRSEHWAVEGANGVGRPLAQRLLDGGRRDPHTDPAGAAGRGELEALRILTDRREAMTRRRVQTVDRLQALLAELVPGRAKRDITTGQAKAMLASVRPRDIAGKTRCWIAAEELAELVVGEAKMKKATAELKAMVLARWGRPVCRGSDSRA